MISERTIPARPEVRGSRIALPLATYWHRVALLTITALAALLNFWGLNGEGYNNEFYAAAVRSMSLNWHNFFFASFDPGGFVTIDKPPLGFWFQVASVKLFGFSGVSLLIPEALAGVLSVLVLYRLVARTFGVTAGLVAALALAVTPISVVTARNNTIDSILVLCVLLGAWAVLRAAETGKLRWLLLSAVIVGLGFNIKMLEAYLVVPAFGLVYLLGTRKSIWRRLGSLVLALVVLLAVSLSWATAVDLTPASARPWVDSTTTNSEIDLAMGYNGLQRLTGNHSLGGPTSGSGGGTSRAGTALRPSSGTSTSASGGRATVGGFGAGGPGGNGGPGGIGENGPTGMLRLLDTQLGSQIGWLLVLAVLGFGVAFVQSRPRFRTLDDRQRSLVLWGTWLLTTGVFFSVALFYHTYYLVMVAPAIAALAGIGVVALWGEYRKPGSRTWWALPAVLLITALVEAHVLASYPSWARWLTPIVVAACALAALCLTVFRLRPFQHLRLAVVSAGLAVLSLLAPATAFASYTVQHTQTGPIVRAGPSASGTSNGFGGPGGLGRPAGIPNGSFGPPPGGFGGPPPGANGSTGQPGGFAPPRSSASSTGRGAFGRRNGGGPGEAVANTPLITYLESHRGTATYLVATPSSNEAAPIIIATGRPVMSLGGFTGSDPILTVSQLASMAKKGEIRYFLLGGRGGPGGPGGSNGLTTWIEQHSKAITVGGTQLYQYTG
jgi:4-amino-4-deoxy-L-arabinose transferase-like glycosyltransferase